ncbi:hypothetical protein BO85DRAFT_489127 [Aspergillus piperis CBS 112811]|uniref:Uncharacterized protein n=1 Tax=Aspergillus piperis CBS 112811 TaxID=1448313 RepID=A0A8G1R131_9EURO|nr:hypothetical protein BO85DRAFT_489127 [Aspergillus piperis CBS 112811]RAH56324.1 hypothetical protein BO85DRAFT_489127 [Aspergillus piperis CBS 112811]
MPAINFPRSATALSHKTIGKRSWAGEEPGVILDFVVVFIVLCGILGLIIQKAWRNHFLKSSTHGGHVRRTLHVRKPLETLNPENPLIDFGQARIFM